uniref:Uncharacterized protein n=1 Tax=Arundo donax TaxID=35708 RepID=A0A0A9AHH0_ARUDO
MILLMFWYLKSWIVLMLLGIFCNIVLGLSFSLVYVIS